MTALVFSREAIRSLDRLAVERYRIPSILLMENAAVHLAAAARRMVAGVDRPRIAIFCGPGNNGGDGLAMARHLHNAGARVRIVLAGDPDRYEGDAATNLAIVRAMGLPLGTTARGRPDLVVDAVLGTGLSKPVREPLAGVIRAIASLRRRGSPVLAVDIPSGLDADTGEPLGIAVTADFTVTLVGLKKGFLTRSGRAHTGTVRIADIGAPRELAASLGCPRR